MNKDVFEKKLCDYYRKSKNIFDPVVDLKGINNTGWESEIFLYTLTSGPESARNSVDCALRLLTGADFANAEREFSILSMLRKAGYPVPKVYELGKPGEIFDRPFIIMQSIQGGQYAAHFPKTPADDQAPLQAFIALFRQLHTLDWRPFVDNPDEIDPPGQPYYHFDRQLAIFSSYISHAAFTALDPAMAWLAEQQERTACKRASVIHYDFHADNILEDESGNLYVIDWTSADISDYRFDLSWTLILALAYGGYVRREMILEEYERQLGNVVPELAVFEAAAIVRRLGFVMLSLANGAERMGVRSEATEAMRREKKPLNRLFARLKRITGLEMPEIQTFLDTL